MSSRQLHFNFSHLDPSVDYTFRHSLYSAKLQRHSPETRKRAAGVNPVLSLVPEERLTHFVDADLPDNTIALTYVTKPTTVGGRPFNHPVHMAIHIPDEGREHVRLQSIRARGGAVPGLHPKLAQHKPSPEAVLSLSTAGVDLEFPAHITDFQDAIDAAVALLFHHFNLINLSTDNGGAIPAIIVEQCILPAVTATQELPLAIIAQGDDWLSATAADGSTSTSLRPSQDTMAAVTGPLQAALATAQNLRSLQGQQWNPRYGVTSAPYGATCSVASPAVASPAAPATRVAAFSRVADVQSPPPFGTFWLSGWVSKNMTSMNGLTVDGSSLVYTQATTTTTWKADGIWSLNDTPSLTAAIATQLYNGALYLRISDQANPQGALQGAIVAGTSDLNTYLTPLTVTLSAVKGATTTATATASFSMNSGRTGLTFKVSAQSLSGEAAAALYVTGDKSGNPIYVLPLSNTTGVDDLSFKVTNTYLRHLSACVQYLDAGGNVLTPKDWSDKVPAFLRKTFEPDSTKPFVALIPPVITVFGVPLPAHPVTISIPVWDEVHTVRLLLGGLGRGPYDSAVCPIGITVTALAELALPAFLLAAGTAVTASKSVKALMADSEVMFAVCAAGIFLVAGPTAAYIALAQDPGQAAEELAGRFAPLLLSPATSLGLWVAEQVAEGAAEQATPFVDIALMIMNAAVTTAQLMETTCEVLQSPFVYEADISRSMPLYVTLYPDPRYNKFPDYHDSIRVTVVYDAGGTTPVHQQTLPPTTLSDPILVSFTSVPAGGRLRIYAFFYASNGWQSGQGVTDWMPALPTLGQFVVDKLVITTNKIPLSASSVYVHTEKIGLVDGKLDWIGAVGTPPTDTVTSPSPFSGQGKEVQRFAAITTAQEPENLAYVWQATGLNLPPDDPSAAATNAGLWTMQNISVLQHPQSGYAAPAVGFNQPPGIAYNMVSADNDATNFFIDSSNPNFDATTNPTGGWHVRAIPLSHTAAPTFAVGSNKSYGRFLTALDRHVYHPQGYVFGISYAANKLFRLQLASAPVADRDAPHAVQSSGAGDRDGLMGDPVGLAVALDGRILVLESANTRVQAFDIYGNAVPYFANPNHAADPTSPATIPTLALTNRAGSTYLDISVEAQGYIYVLSYTGDGSLPSMYQVDLYTPTGALLVTTPNVAAARMVVNILRDLYTLNYELFLDGAGRVQPSISMWLPPPPDPGSSGGDDQ